VHFPGSVKTTSRLLGQFTKTGASASTTAIVKLQAFELPLESTAVQMTVVSPRLKTLPLDGVE
jgi:hypothetical protein